MLRALPCAWTRWITWKSCPIVSCLRPRPLLRSLPTRSRRQRRPRPRSNLLRARHPRRLPRRKNPPRSRGPSQDTAQLIEKDILAAYDEEKPAQPLPADTDFRSEFKLDLDELKFGRNYEPDK